MRFLYKLYVQYWILGIKKYRINRLSIDDNYLTLSLIKIKDLGYENNNQLTPREMTEVEKVFSQYFTNVLIDYMSREFNIKIK